MCNDKNDGNTSFAVERNLLSGIFTFNNVFSAILAAILVSKTVCFERDVTALNTLTSHETIKPDCA